MPEPVTTELPQPQRLTIGETPVYLLSPLEVNGEQVAQMTIRGQRSRGKDGLESAVLLIKEQSRRRGEEGQSFGKPLPNVNDMEEVDWDKVKGLQYTAPDGAIHTIAKDQLSLEKPIFDKLDKLDKLDKSGTPEPTLARKILETYSGAPTTLTIVGLKAYETRAHDLADKAMQLKTSLGERIWKQGMGPVYFHEKTRQYYMDMLKAGNSPFAAESIKIAEAAGFNRYQELLKNKNFLTRGSRQFIEWVKDNLGMRTLTQKFALEEIAAMRETGEIREREAFDREATSIRKRFEMDVENQDEYIRKNLGEDIALLDPVAHPEHKPLVDEIKTLVRRYASGEIATKADFDAATDTLFQTHLKGGRPDLFAQAELYTSSLYEVAEGLRTKANHEGGLAAIDAQLESMQVRLGMGVMGEATALEPTDVQRGTDMVRGILTKLEKKGIIGPFLFNEATVASGVAVALSLVVLPKMGVSTLARGLGGPVAGAAIGALFGGVREYRMLEREYLTHLREREAGLTFSSDSKRRAWMERFFVGQRSADELIASLATEAVTEDDVRIKLANLADAKARKALSAREHERNRQRVGMIQYSARENIESERSALDLTIAQAEKDLLASGKTTKEFLTDLTAAQTRVLNEGLEGIEGLDDPIKVTLGLLEKYNPTVDIMRRRFPLLGQDAKTGAKAQGLEEIFKEFRRAARGQAVRKGLVVGATGALIGFGVREGLQLGTEITSGLSEKFPAPQLPPVDVNSGQSFLFSPNLHLDGADLVTPDPTDPNKSLLVVDGLKQYLGASRGAFNPDGTLSESAKQFIEAQARDHGYALQFPEAIKTSVEFSGNTHTLADIVASQPVHAPTELNWVFTPDGRQLMLDVKDIHNNVFQTEIYHDSLHQGEPSGALTEILKRPGLLPYTPGTPGGTIEHDVPFDHIRVRGIPDIIDTYNNPHSIFADVPDNAHLVRTGPGTYNLLDAGNKHLLDGIKIDDYGKVLNEPALNASGLAQDHNIEISSVPVERITTTTGAGAGETFDKVVGEMGEEKGFHGPWGWLEDPINASKDVGHKLPGTNLAKNLFRGFEENVVHKANFYEGGTTLNDQFSYTSMHAPDVFKDLPKTLFFDQPLPDGRIPLVELGKIMDRAIELTEVQHIDFSALTPAQIAALGLKQEDVDVLEAAYQIGRVGRVATDKEVQMFIDYLGGGTKETTVQLFQPTIRQIITEVIPPTEPIISGIPTSLVWNQISLGERLPVPEFPIIPIPLIWRWPLETPLLHAVPGLVPPEFTPPTYFTYGGEQVFLTGDEYTNRRSPRLTQDSEKKLNEQEELSWYLSTLTVEDRQSLDELMAQHTNPVPDAVRAVIAIPANKEGLNMYATLSQYAKQRDLRGNALDPTTYEIVIYDNRTKESAPDNTKEEVMRFTNDHPDMNIVYLEHVLAAKPTIGRVRRNLTNFVLKRLEGRTAGLPDVAIVSNDADSIDIPQTYLATIMDGFEKNPRLDAVTGWYDFPEQAYKNYPVLFATERAWQLMDAIVRYNEQSGIPQLMGANSAVRASTLAAIGGYNSKSPLGEDLEVGWMIQAARKSDPTRFLFLSALTLETDPRRAVYKYLQGAGLLDRYTDFADNDEVRGQSWQELATRAQEAYSREKLEENLTRLRSELYPWLKTKNPEALDRYFTRAMDFLGVAYELRGDKVVITDDSVLRSGINAGITSEQVVKQISSPPPTPLSSTMEA